MIEKKNISHDLGGNGQIKKKQRGRKKLSVRGRIQREWWKVNEELPQDAILFFFLIKQRKGNLFLRGSGDNAAKFSK